MMSESLKNQGSVVEQRSADQQDFKPDNVFDLTPEQQKAIWRKVDIRLVPIVALLYLFSFLDRGNIGNAKLQGLTTQLKLTGNKYNVAVAVFFIPYCLFECPSNLVLKKFRPSRWLPTNAILWGLVMTMMGLVKNYPQLVGVRVCLGFAESGLFPGVVYYLTLWYPRHKLQYRVALFFGAASVSGAFSGLLAFGIGYMSGVDGKLGWSWICILEGCATICVGILAFFVMVDSPATAKFLTPEERDYIVWIKSTIIPAARSLLRFAEIIKEYDNSSVGEEENFEFRHIKLAFLDWQVWLNLLVYYSIITPLYGISLFLPSIIHGFGYTTAISQLLTVPPYVFATILLLFFAHYSDKLKMRYPFILAGLLICLAGFAINTAKVSTGVQYFGIFLCVGGSYAAFPGVVAWLGNNLAGQYKRSVGMAMQIGLGSLGGAIASNIFRAQDGPRYIMGFGIELMFICIGLIALPLLVLIYSRINSKREALMIEIEEKGSVKYTDEEIRRLGDRAPEFRYIL